MKEDRIFYQVRCSKCWYRWCVQKGESLSAPDHEPIGDKWNNPFKCLGSGQQGSFTGKKMNFNPPDEVEL